MGKIGKSWDAFQKYEIYLTTVDGYMELIVLGGRWKTLRGAEKNSEIGTYMYFSMETKFEKSKALPWHT